MDVTACDLSSGAALGRWPGSEPDEAEARSDFAQFLATELGEVEAPASSGHLDVLPDPTAGREAALDGVPAAPIEPRADGAHGVQARPDATAAGTPAPWPGRDTGPNRNLQPQFAEYWRDSARLQEGVGRSEATQALSSDAGVTAAGTEADDVSTSQPVEQDLTGAKEMPPSSATAAPPRSAAARALLAALAAADAETREAVAQVPAGEVTAPAKEGTGGQAARAADPKGVVRPVRTDAPAHPRPMQGGVAAEAASPAQGLDAQAGSADTGDSAAGYQPPAAAPSPVASAPAAAPAADAAPVTPAPVPAVAAATLGSVPRVQAPPAPLAPEIPEPVQQIVSALRLQVRDGVTEARVRLRPEHLGEVVIAVRLDRDRVSAVLQVERADVRGLIEAQSQALRAQLAAHGLHLEDFSVREDGRGSQHRGHEQRSRQDGRRPRPDTAHAFILPEDL